MSIPNTLPANEASYAALDIESTGLSYENGDRILEIAVTHIDNGILTGSWSTLVNPGSETDPGPTDIHRIDRGMLDLAPSFTDIAGTLTEKLRGRVLVAHHARFDLPFIRHEYELAGYEWPSPWRMCTLEGSRFLLPYLRKHRLGDLCEHFGIDFEGWHAAEADADACARVHLALLNLVPGLLVPDQATITWPEVPIVHTGTPRPS